MIARGSARKMAAHRPFYPIAARKTTYEPRASR
jgi:hypothetical protein